MTDKHTPGPWKVTGEYNVFSDDYGRVALLENPYHSRARLAADASLIAAAPELLEAVLRGVAVLRDGATLPQLESWAAFARAAIANATKG